MGAVSRVASAVAAVSQSLSTLPLIGRWASAAEIGANGLAAVAGAFGYSKAVELVEATPVKVTQFSGFTYTSGLDQSQKLTSDPKAALAIDNSYIGAGFDDELAITSIASRESYYDSVAWPTTAATDTILFTIPVCPGLCKSSAVTGGVKYYPTALAFTTLGFNYWTGSIKLRLEIVGASLHTGKLRVTYVPDGGAFVGTSLNTTFSQIIDATEVRDHCFSIPMAQNRPWLGCQLAIGTSSYLATTCNGVVYVTVLNPCGSILSTQGMYVNVYISGGDDYRVAYPSLSNLNGSAAMFTYFPPQ